MFKEVGLVPQLQNIYDDRYNAIGRLRGSGGGPAILMSGHMDTSVRGDEDYLTGKGWKNHAVVDGGRIYGNGVMNMKNAFVSYIAGVHALQRAGMLSKQALAGVIEPRIEEIFSLVQQVIRESGYEEVLSSGVVLTGGSAVMPGMVELGEDIFLKPVRRGIPKYSSALSDMHVCTTNTR